MNCPYCSAPLQAGTIRFDGRTLMRWLPEGKKVGFWDSLGGVGQLTAAQYPLFANGKLPGHYCSSCKKLIIDTDVAK